MDVMSPERNQRALARSALFKSSDPAIKAERIWLQKHRYHAVTH
ncbi:unnamed protein product, partial [Linum tenue]